MTERLQEQMPQVISVCDREAGIYEYLQYKRTEKQRFVVRSMQNRHIEEAGTNFMPFSGTLPNMRWQGWFKLQPALKGIT